MHETDAECRLRVEALTGEEVAPRMLPDLRQHKWRDDGRDDPELHLAEAEDCLGCGDRNVCAGREAGAAAECVPVDACDDRSWAAVDRLAHPVEPERVVDVVLEGELDCRA